MAFFKAGSDLHWQVKDFQCYRLDSCWDTSSFTHYCFCTISANASSVKNAINALVLLRKWFSPHWLPERVLGVRKGLEKKKKSLASSFPKHFEAISYLLSQSHHYFLLNACVSHWKCWEGRDPSLDYLLLNFHRLVSRIQWTEFLLDDDIKCNDCCLSVIWTGRKHPSLCTWAWCHCFSSDGEGAWW